MDSKGGSGSSNKLSKEKLNMIKRLAINKHRRGARKAGAMVGASFRSSDEGWSKRKVQAMTEDQKATS